MTTDCEHTRESLPDEEIADIRRKTRTGRPNGAWLEGVSRCSKCGALEARVSWYGQVLPAAVTVSDTETKVHWPTRQQASGGAMGMG
jgi:hypothetical protein